jgi:hypothetical protein
VNYLGDFSEDATVRVVLTTNNGDGAAVAPSSAFEAADFRVYKNGSATQKATTNGITITSPFDSVTGLHILEIDTSNDTGDSGFWTTGADYWIVATPDETIDSQTVVGVIATFSIQNRYSSARLAAIEEDTLDIQSRIPTSLDGGNMRSSVQNIAAIADAVWDEPYAQHNIAGSFGKLLNTIRKSNLAIEGEVTNAITPTTLTFSSNISATTSAYAHAVLLFVDGPLAGENSPIISYNNTNGVFVLEEPLTAAPSNGDEFVVIAGSHVHDIASIQSGLATSAGVTAGFTEIKGTGWSSSTDTLEKIAESSGGGGSSIMVTPVVAQTPVRVVGSNISTFIGDLSTIRVGIFSGEDAVDLSAFGNLEVCVQRKNGTDLDFVEMPDLTIDGDDNNYVSWDPSGSSVAEVIRGKWSLRKSSNKQVIAYGAWIVEDAALEDVGS